ncbi:hemerythrin domain-containing protein [Streptosporangiaceae bacterium NEAU-GS5]|nr:hemerythrin domain-containing protein [Streptosporangiaceae bacterium NEAU-GS5]
MAIDFSIMYAAHDAFRRDLRKLTEEWDQGRWEQFKRQLLIHHQAEDELVWPLMRGRVAGDAAGVALIDEMEAEHAQIDPLLEAADVTTLRALLDHHLQHEETMALPLIDKALDPAEWTAFSMALRDRQGGPPEWRAFFLWLLEDAPSQTKDNIRGVLPPEAHRLLD